MVADDTISRENVPSFSFSTSFLSRSFHLFFVLFLLIVFHYGLHFSFLLCRYVAFRFNVFRYFFFCYRVFCSFVLCYSVLCHLVFCSFVIRYLVFRSFVFCYFIFSYFVFCSLIFFLLTSYLCIWFIHFNIVAFSLYLKRPQILTYSVGYQAMEKKKASR